jgi:hypothetical protein
MSERSGDRGQIAGAKMKSGVGTEFLDIKNKKATGHGEFVENIENGEKNVYTYEFFGNSKNGAFESGTNNVSSRRRWKDEGRQLNRHLQGEGQSRPVHLVRLHRDLHPRQDIAWLYPSEPKEFKNEITFCNPNSPDGSGHSPALVLDHKLNSQNALQS